jgi:hypothetical protein
VRVVRAIPVLLAVVLTGCNRGQPPPVLMPNVSPEEAAKAAMSSFDADRDGALDAKELEKSPGLLSCLKSWDLNADGKLDQQEILSRIEAHRKTQVGLQSVTCEVSFNGTPLEGAKVTFVPERFLGPNVKPATGISDQHGLVLLQIEGEELPGVHVGVFQVEVSKLDAAGKEMIPEKYNTQTILGQEVMPNLESLRGGVKLQLSN